MFLKLIKDFGDLIDFLTFENNADDEEALSVILKNKDDICKKDDMIDFVALKHHLDLIDSSLFAVSFDLNFNAFIYFLDSFKSIFKTLFVRLNDNSYDFKNKSFKAIMNLTECDWDSQNGDIYQLTCSTCKTKISIAFKNEIELCPDCGCCLISKKGKQLNAVNFISACFEANVIELKEKDNNFYEIIDFGIDKWLVKKPLTVTNIVKYINIPLKSSEDLFNEIKSLASLVSDKINRLADIIQNDFDYFSSEELTNARKDVEKFNVEEIKTNLNKLEDFKKQILSIIDLKINK